MSWIGLNLEDRRRVEVVRDLVSNAASDAYGPVDPHVTVHSGIRGNGADPVGLIEPANRLVGNTVLVGGVYFWPSPEEPRVVALESRVDGLAEARDGVAEAAAESRNARIEHDPTPPHVTLLKTGDPGDKSWGESAGLLTTEQTEALLGAFGGWETTVAGVFYES